jgi:hypothetical protein
VKEDEIDRTCSTQGEKRNLCKILVGRSEGMKQLEDKDAACRITLKVISEKYDGRGMDWIHLAKDGDHWGNLFNTVMYLIFHKILGNS